MFNGVFQMLMVTMFAMSREHSLQEKSNSNAVYQVMYTRR